MDYELVLSFYKSFCTKISNFKTFFDEDSTFFFVGDSGKTFIAYGKEDIEQQIEEQFWTKVNTYADKTLIAYNISIEKKTQIVCPESTKLVNGCIEKRSAGVAITVIGMLREIRSEEDIQLTKALGRRFTQTFLISIKDEKYIQSSVFAFLAPTLDLLNTMVKTEVATTLSSISGDVFESQHKLAQNEENVTDLDFEKIVKNIDKLMDENNDLNEDLKQNKVDFNCNELMPISINELFEENSSDDKRQQLNQSFSFEQYFNDVWTQSQNLNKSAENESENWEKNENSDKCIETKSQETSDDHNSGISFADVLRDGLQSWQSIKTEEKPNEIRIISNCSKSKFKQNCLKTSGDRKSEFLGQQNITIIGAQNLEDFSDNRILFVANIPIGFPKTEFRNLFDIYGKVLSIKFVERIGVSFAFIYFESSQNVDDVFQSTTGNNNLSLDGLQLKVDRYRPRIPLYLI